MTTDAIVHEYIYRDSVGYPHAGGCQGCRKLNKCNYCGAQTSMYQGRCTNGRCKDCHRNVCTTNMDGTAHGYGEQG